MKTCESCDEVGVYRLTIGWGKSWSGYRPHRLHINITRIRSNQRIKLLRLLNQLKPQTLIHGQLDENIFESDSKWIE